MSISYISYLAHIVKPVIKYSRNLSCLLWFFMIFCYMQFFYYYIHLFLLFNPFIWIVKLGWTLLRDLKFIRFYSSVKCQFFSFLLLNLRLIIFVYKIGCSGFLNFSSWFCFSNYVMFLLKIQIKCILIYLIPINYLLKR